MKTVLSMAIASLLLSASAAHATGITLPVYKCKGGAGEDAASINLDSVMINAPGGAPTKYFEASASSSWLGGTHKSGAVRVERSPTRQRAQIYTNREAGFELVIYSTSEAQNAAGRPASIEVSAKFKDPKTGMAGQITRRVLKCQ